MIVVLSACCFGCGAFRTVAYLENYSEFLEDFTKYFPEKSEELPQIDRFDPIVPYAFINGQLSVGNRCYVKSLTGDYVLGYDGALQAVGFDTAGYRLRYGHLIFQENSRYGVKDDHGTVMIPAEYDACDIYEKTVLCVKQNTVYLYRLSRSQAVLQARSDFRSTAELLNESTVLIDGTMYDDKLVPLSTGGYAHCSITVDGMTVIQKDNRFGFIGINGEWIEPIYDTVMHFTGAYASATRAGSYCVIDRKGAVVYESQTNRVLGFYDGYFCFYDGYYYGIMDQNFRIVCPAVFPSLYGSRVYGSYVIEDHSNCIFYNIATKQYDEREFTYVSAAGNHFICRTKAGDYALLNENLIPIIENCDRMEYLNGILLIGKNERLIYYREKQIA